MTSTYFDNPDWIPNQSWQLIRVLDGETTYTLADGAFQESDADALPGVNVAGLLVFGTGRFSVESFQVLGVDIPPDVFIPVESRIVSDDAGTAVWLPLQEYTHDLQWRVFNLAGADNDLTERRINYLNTPPESLLTAPYSGTADDPAVTAGDPLAGAWVDQGGLYDALSVVGVSDGPATLVARWYWWTFDGTATLRSADEPLATTVANVVAVASVPIRAPGLELIYTNTAPLDDAAMSITWHLTRQS